MPTIRQGTLVWTPVVDPSGNIPKPHPVLVISSNTDVKQLPQIAGIVCSHSASLRSPRPDCWIALPYHPDGKCSTKLRKSTVAIPTWVVMIPSSGYAPSDVGGWAPARIVLEVIQMAESIRQGCVPTVSCFAVQCRSLKDLETE